MRKLKAMEAEVYSIDFRKLPYSKLPEDLLTADNLYELEWLIDFDIPEEEIEAEPVD